MQKLDLTCFSLEKLIKARGNEKLYFQAQMPAPPSSSLSLSSLLSNTTIVKALIGTL